MIVRDMISMAQSFAITTDQVMCRVTRQLNRSTSVSPLTPLGIRRPLLAPESTSRYAESSAPTTTAVRCRSLNIWGSVPKTYEPQDPTGLGRRQTG